MFKDILIATIGVALGVFLYGLFDDFYNGYCVYRHYKSMRRNEGSHNA